MKTLFICNQGQNRSKTAELLFKDKFNTKSAGLYNNIVTEKEIEWAEVIFVMTDEQRKEISKRFPKQYLQKIILSLNISDVYYFNQPELIELLNKKLRKKNEAINLLAN